MYMGRGTDVRNMALDVTGHCKSKGQLSRELHRFANGTNIYKKIHRGGIVYYLIIAFIVNFKFN